MIDAAFGNWLAGFIDGEGCFRIKPINMAKAKSGFACTFSLKLRDDDAPILVEIVERVGFGHLLPDRRSVNGSKPGMTWYVQRRMDCVSLSLLLERYPLRAKKARDLEIWREALDALCEWPPDYERMSDLAEELKRVRAYKPYGGIFA